MSERKLTDAMLAAIVAASTAFGVIVAALFDTFVLDADTQKQSDLQLVQVAIGILSQPSVGATGAPDTALRGWAVDTVNAAAEVKFDNEAKEALIDGRSGFDTSAITAMGNALRELTEPDFGQEPYVLVTVPPDVARVLEPTSESPDRQSE